MAEGVGFEPTVGYQPTTVFKTAALSRSAIPPALSPEEYGARLWFDLVIPNGLSHFWHQRIAS